MAKLEKKYKKKAKLAGQKATGSAFMFKGEGVRRANKIGKKARVASERKSAVKQTLKNTVKKSFKAGASRGAMTTAKQGTNVTVFTRRNNAIGKVAGKAGRVYKMTAAHKQAISAALKGKKRR